MDEVSRRECVGEPTAGTATATVPIPPRTQPSKSTFLVSDIGSLRRVLVHQVTAEDAYVERLSPDLLPFGDADMEGAAEQHGEFVKLLRTQGAEVVELETALDDAIAATRRTALFELWIDTAFPELAGEQDRINARSILGRDPAFRYRLGEDGMYRHLANKTVATIFTRDSAVMTPQGVVICRAESPRRRRENMLLRFLYRYAPQLNQYPVVFDAVQEGLIMEGGDVMVVDERTLFVGTGTRTDPRTAPLLARRLNMDVLAIQKAKADYLAPIRSGQPQKLADLKGLLLHLDTFFTLVGPGHALAVPYLLEKEHAEDNPLSRFIRGARADTLMDPDDAESALEMLKEFGRVTLYRAGNGSKEDLGDLKLVDYLRAQGYRFTYVGGARPTGDQAAFEQFMQVSAPELVRQGCNVVQAQAGAVIAYDGNSATKLALQADGVQVNSFPARELRTWRGGPHCLTQPLERA